MKNLLATVLGACVAMLLTSGVVALATAHNDDGPVDVEKRTIEDASVPTDEAYAELTDDEVDTKISALIDQQHAKAQRTL
jgi:hypothetical protein